MSYAILINPYVKKLRLTKTIPNFAQPKEITFMPFFGRERIHDEVFFIFEDGELKKFRGLYVVVGENIGKETIGKIKKKIVWCSEEDNDF